jgi:hypothetical protein
MKTLVFAAAAALSLVAASAQAASGVGNGDPFPFRAAAMTVVSPSSYTDTGSVAYPNIAGRASQLVTADGSDGVPITGGQTGVETANSLPRGFREGTVTYAQEHSVQRYAAAQVAARSGRLVQTAQAPSGKHRG